MSDQPLHHAGPLGIALLSLDLIGFDAHALDLSAPASGEVKASSDDFRLSGALGDTVTLQLDYSDGDKVFYIAVLLAAITKPESGYLEALKVNYLLAPPRQIVFDSSANRLGVRSELILDGIAVEDLAFELHYLVEIALVLSGFSETSEPSTDLGAGGVIRG